MVMVVVVISGVMVVVMVMVVVVKLGMMVVAAVMVMVVINVASMWESRMRGKNGTYLEVHVLNQLGQLVHEDEFAARVHLLHVLHELSFACSVDHRIVKVKLRKEKKNVSRERKDRSTHSCCECSGTC
jgi:hypothetical protein